MKLISIKTFDNTSEAHIYKSKLENEGILCFLKDENSVSVNPFNNIALGGIKLQVPEDAVDTALNVLIEMQAQPFTDEAGNIVTCKNCNGLDFYRTYGSGKAKDSIWKLIFGMFLAPLPMSKSILKCKNCEQIIEID